MNFPRPIIKELWTYPIKSCGGVSHDSQKTTSTGLGDDRIFVIVGKDENGENEVLTQRKYPTLAKVALRKAEGGYLIDALNETLFLDLETEMAGKPERVTLFEKSGRAAEVHPQIGELFSELVDRDVRLMREVDARVIKPATFSSAMGANNQTAFADGYPMLIASQASLGQVNKWLANEGHEAIDMARFKPNIVFDTAYDVQGNSTPFGEDFWKGLKLGNVGAAVVRACARCAISAINPETGEFDAAGRALNHVLNTYRRGTDPVNGRKGRFFGQNIVHNYIAQDITVDDTITVYHRVDQRNIAGLE